MGDTNTSVVGLIEEAEDGTTVITTIDSRSQSWLENAMATYDPQNKVYSAYLNFSGTSGDMTLDQIEQLGENAQTNLDNVIAINNMVRKQININDIVGMVVQSIDNNINTTYRLSYRKLSETKKVMKTLERAKTIITDFNMQIDIEGLIANAISLAYCEGNYNCVLRQNGENWTVDYLPLGVVEQSGYTNNGRPVLLINIQKLKDALQKTMLRNRRNQPLFFKNVNEEIEKNYPSEVYDAAKANETYAVLDADYTGSVRVNNRGRKYGLTPIFRALPSIIMLNDYQNADTATAKSKAKKIIHQVLRKEVLGPTGDRNGFDIMAYSHRNFMSAFRNDTVVYTSPAAVEKIEYVEPKTDDIAVEKVSLYRNKILSSLGVSFLTNDNSQTASTATISLKQLLQCINGISRQVERMLENFYRTVLRVNGIGPEYMPSITIVDAEMMEPGMQMELAKLLYGTFACSRQTALRTIGIDLEDETWRRQKENEDALDEVFTPYPTSYNVSGNAIGEEPENGRPAGSNDTEKQAYDEEYNQNARQ